MEIRLTRLTSLSVEERDSWSEIQESCSEFSSPFFRPEFAEQVAAARGDASVAVLLRDGKAVGFLPFQLTGRGVGEPIGAPLSDMQGVVIPSGTDWSAADVLRSAGLSAWHFDHLLASQSQFESHHSYVDDSPFMDLSEGYDAYCIERRASGSRTIAQIQRKRRKLERDKGSVRFEWQSDSESILETLIAWKRKQLEVHHYSDLFVQDWVRGLITSVWRSQETRFAGVLSTLRAGDELVAVHLGIRSRNVLSSWIPTYNPDYSRYSPGAVLHLDLAMEAARLGIERIELGRGGNQLKAALRSDGTPVAVGSVDNRLFGRLATQSWYGARKLVYSLPFSEQSIAIYRRIRNAVATT